MFTWDSFVVYRALGQVWYLLGIPVFSFALLAPWLRGANGGSGQEPVWRLWRHLWRGREWAAWVGSNPPPPPSVVVFVSPLSDGQPSSLWSAQAFTWTSFVIYCARYGFRGGQVSGSGM